MFYFFITRDLVQTTRAIILECQKKNLHFRSFGFVFAIEIFWHCSSFDCVDASKKVKKNIGINTKHFTDLSITTFDKCYIKENQDPERSNQSFQTGLR